MRPKKAAKGQKNFETQKSHRRRPKLKIFLKSQVVGRGQIMGDG